MCRKGNTQAANTQYRIARFSLYCGLRSCYARYLPRDKGILKGLGGLERRGTPRFLETGRGLQGVACKVEGSGCSLQPKHFQQGFWGTARNSKL